MSWSCLLKIHTQFRSKHHFHNKKVILGFFYLKSIEMKGKKKTHQFFVRQSSGKRFLAPQTLTFAVNTEVTPPNKNRFRA